MTLIILISGAVTLIVMGIKLVTIENAQFGLVIAGVGILPLLVREGFHEVLSYLKSKTDTKDSEEDLKQLFKKTLVRLVYHWDLGTIRPSIGKLQEDVVSFLEQNIVDLLKEVDEVLFEKIEEFYKLGLDIKVPLQISKENYKTNASKEFVLEKFDSFLEISKSFIGVL